MKCKKGIVKTLEVIGGKWKPLLLGLLYDNEVLRNSEFRKLAPQITQKMLTQQLRELENDDLIIRKVYDQLPPKVEYRLSEKGKTIIPLLESMADWGYKYRIHDDINYSQKKHS